MTTVTLHAAGRKARAARVTLCMAALLSASVLSGCGDSNKLSYEKLAVPYSAAQIGRSTSLEVLNTVRGGAYEFDPDRVDQVLLTQSDTVIGFSGRSSDTRKSWLNMIVFDEFRMVAGRKYFFCVDERATRAPDNPKKRLFPSRQGILFDTQFVIDPEVLTTPYATEEAQQIAILQWLAGRFEQDVAALIGNPKDPARGSEVIVQSGGMVSQVFQGVLAQLDMSPGLAKNLGDERGVAFPHMSLGQGRIRMAVQSNVAAVSIRVNLPIAEDK